MFIDKAHINVQAGKGGDGAVAWRREKFEPAGGPHGGDGGRGGSVIIKTDTGIHTLMDFRYKRKYKAPNGENGMSKLKYGAKGEDIVLKVPVGTLVKDEDSGGVIVDLNKPNMEYIIAKGGRGGRGNAKFKNSTRQAPSFAEAGNLGENRNIILELKMLADVGLVGFPNVGKSTLLSVVSNARPKIANYHFTTLEPNLGVVSLGPEESFVLADIPGLIEGASEGIGLGDEFLRHIERTKVLIHIIDASGSEGRDPVEDFYKIMDELKGYNEKLMNKPMVIFMNKMDIPGSEEGLEKITKELGDKYEIFSGSVATTKNVDKLMKYVLHLVNTTELEEETYDIEYVEPEREEGIKVYVNSYGEYTVDGLYIDKLLRSTNFDDRDSIRYFQENLTKNKVIEKLRELGATDDDTVIIGGYEFEFFK